MNRIEIGYVMEKAPIAIKFKQVMKEDKNTKCVSQFYYLLFIKSSNLMTTYCMSLHLKFFSFFSFFLQPIIFLNYNSKIVAKKI